jgi:hypothetical protein
VAAPPAPISLPMADASSPPAAPVVVPNGWGSFVGLESAAFIWHSSPESVAYFTAEITVVPAPASLALLSLFALGRRRR